MAYVPTSQFGTNGVTSQNALCYKVTGKWEDLCTLASQIKWLGKEHYNVVLVAGLKRNFKEPQGPHELVVTGDIYLPDDKTIALVEQRIQEGFEVSLVYDRFFCSAVIYTYKEPVNEQTQDETLGELEKHPF